MSRSVPLYFFVILFGIALNLTRCVESRSGPRLEDYTGSAEHLLFTIGFISIGGIIASLMYRFLVR